MSDDLGGLYLGVLFPMVSKIKTKLIGFCHKFNTLESSLKLFFITPFFLGLFVGKVVTSSQQNSTIQNREPSSISDNSLNDQENQQENQVEEFSNTKSVIVNPAVQRDIRNTFNTHANLLPWREVKVYPIEKVTIKTVKAQIGQKVKKGEVLAIVDSEANSLRKELEELEYKLKQSDFAVSKTLAHKKFISKNEFNNKKMEMRAGEIRRKIQAIESKREILKSPISGTVAAIKVKEGDYIDNPSKFYIKIIDDSAYKVQLHLPQSISKNLFIDGTSIISKEFRDESGFGYTEKSEGIISMISPEVDPKSGTVFVEVALKNPLDSWKSGMYVKVSMITAESKKTISVPTGAIIFKKDQPIIYRVIASENGDKIEEIKPIIGLNNGKFTEILSGINLDDEIVTQGQGSLTNGEPVEIIYP